MDAVGPLDGGRGFFYKGHLFSMKYGHKIKYNVLLDILIGWKIKLALHYKLEFTNAHTSLEKYIIH
jgi:hypothetical protein